MTPYFQTDSVALYLGDCLSILPVLPAEAFHAVITDPPYFQPAAHYCPTRDEGAPKKTLADMSILAHFFRAFLNGCARTLRPDGSAYVFCDGQSYSLAFEGLHPHAKYVRPLVWDKVISFNGYTWRHQHELIAWGEFREAARIPTGDGDILRFRAVPVRKRTHPAEKPVELVAALLNKTNPASLVLDPFAGSGTTGVACLQTGRRFLGVELSEQYCEIAARRLEKAAAETPLFMESP